MAATDATASGSITMEIRALLATDHTNQPPAPAPTASANRGDRAGAELERCAVGGRSLS